MALVDVACVLLITGYYIDTVPFMKFSFYEVSMASLHVLTCGMGKRDES